MQMYHNAFAANNTRLPEFLGLPLLDWREPAHANSTKSPYPAGLTTGGRVIFSRTRRSVSTCNLLARLAGLGQEAEHVG